MTMASHRRPFVSLVVLWVGVSLCGGCTGLKYGEIFGAGALGAGVGALIGHQSNEGGTGAAVGAAILATGDLLHQIDQINEKKLEKAADEVAKGSDLLNPALWER